MQQEAIPQVLSNVEHRLALVYRGRRPTVHTSPLVAVEWYALLRETADELFPGRGANPAWIVFMDVAGYFG